MKILQISTMLGVLAAIVLITAIPAAAQQNAAAPAATSNTEPEMNAFLRYREAIADENKAFLDFIQKTVGGAVVLAGGFLAFLNWRTSADVRKAAEAQLNQAVDAQLVRVVSKALDGREMEISTAIAEELDKRIADQKAHMEKKLRDLESELSERSKLVDRWLVTLSQEKPPNTEQPKQATEDEIYKGVAILWVDDYPANNAGQIRILEGLGASVDAVTTTDAALERLKRPDQYRVIISDMGREGEGRSAGLTLLDRLTALNIHIPTILFCSSRALREFGDAAIQKGAYSVTTGNAALFRALSSALQGRAPIGVQPQ